MNRMCWGVHVVREQRLYKYRVCVKEVVGPDAGPGQWCGAGIEAGAA